MAHLSEMDYLRYGIGLRALGQRDPLVEYKNEAYSAFQNLTATMYDDFLRTFLRLEINIRIEQPEPKPEEQKMQFSSPESALENTSVRSAVSGQQAQQVAAAGAAAAGAAPKPAMQKAATVVKDKDDPFANVGRNDPCPCGSGLKYKKCHGK